MRTSLCTLSIYIHISVWPETSDRTDCRTESTLHNNSAHHPPGKTFINILTHYISHVFQNYEHSRGPLTVISWILNQSLLSGIFSIAFSSSFNMKHFYLPLSKMHLNGFPFSILFLKISINIQTLSHSLTLFILI